MTKPAAVDTNVLVALLNPSDSLHATATELYARVKNSDAVFVFFDVVVIEAVTVIARRLEEKKRSNEFDTFVDQLLAFVPPSEIEWILSSAESRFGACVALMRQPSGKLQFNDALIALACRELGIETILSFDADFDSIPDLTRLK